MTEGGSKRVSTSTNLDMIHDEPFAPDILDASNIGTSITRNTTSFVAPIGIGEYVTAKDQYNDSNSNNDNSNNDGSGTPVYNKYVSLGETENKPPASVVSAPVRPATSSEIRLQTDNMRHVPSDYPLTATDNETTYDQSKNYNRRAEPHTASQNDGLYTVSRYSGGDSGDDHDIEATPRMVTADMDDNSSTAHNSLEKKENMDESHSLAESSRTASLESKRGKCKTICIVALALMDLIFFAVILYFVISNDQKKSSLSPADHRNASTGNDSSSEASSMFSTLYPVPAPKREHIYNDDPEVQDLLNNPELRQAFYGISYSSRNARYPTCGVSQREVTLDMAVLSQVTNRVRLYGTDCDQVIYVLNAIEDLGLNMTVSLGVWIGATPDISIRQIDAARDILARYPSHLFNSILIGNEAIFRGDVTDTQLAAYIDFLSDFVQSSNMSIPIGTSEIGSLWTHTLAEHVNILAANIHPFFGGVHVNESTKWTYDFLFRQVANTVNPYQGSYMISEVGWPSGGGNLQGAVAGLDELQEFLDTWLCTNKDSDIGWYWFEAFDAPWKQQWNTADSQWETQWGLFTTDRKLKEIVIPECV